MSDVFLSYAAADRERLRPLVRFLEDRGWSVWWDRRIDPGASFQRTISEAIAAARCVVVCWTERAVDSDWVLNEASEAKERGILVPLLLDDVRPPLGFRMDHAVDLRAWRGDAAHPELELLEQAVERRAGSAPPREPHPSEPSRASSVLAHPARWGLGALAALALTWGAYEVAGPSLEAPPAGKTPILERPAVAVLPFANLTGDPDRDYLSLGLMDEVIVGLQQYRAFPVVSRRAVLALDGHGETPASVADALDVAYLVTGSISGDARALRVNVTLTDASGAQVWAKRFELDAGLETLFERIDEIAASVAAGVRDSEVRRVTAVRRPAVAAWEHYVKALEVIMNWHPERYEEGIAHARRALELDPEMAEAWWALGQLEVGDVMTLSAGEGRALLESAERHFRNAREISPFHGATCGCLSFILASRGDFEEALTLLDQALETNPLSSALRVDYAGLLAAHGDFARARAMAESSLRMEPRGADLAVAHLYIALAHLGEGHRAAATRALHRALFVERTHVMVAPVAVGMLYALGRPEDAAALYADFERVVPSFDPANPVTRVQTRPVDAFLRERRARGAELPADTREIFRLLAERNAARETDQAAR